jgi:hypothetical protein
MPKERGQPGQQSNRVAGICIHRQVGVSHKGTEGKTGLKGG